MNTKEKGREPPPADYSSPVRVEVTGYVAMTFNENDELRFQVSKDAAGNITSVTVVLTTPPEAFDGPVLSPQFIAVCRDQNIQDGVMDMMHKKVLELYNKGLLLDALLRSSKE